VLLLVPARTYRAADFLLAAARLGLDLVVGSDGALPLGGRPVIPVSPGDPDKSARRILSRSGPVDAVVAADTPMLVLAAAVAARMGLPHFRLAEGVHAFLKDAHDRERKTAAQFDYLADRYWAGAVELLRQLFGNHSDLVSSRRIFGIEEASSENFQIAHLSICGVDA
jgi:hypothetical protein